MAASVPSMPMSFNSQIPVTPPPDHQMFMKRLPPQFQNPVSTHHLHPQQPLPSVTTTTKKPSTASRSGSILKPDEKPINHQLHHHLHNTQIRHPPSALPTATSNLASQTTCPPPSPHSRAAGLGIDPTAAASGAAVDPRYIAMASRIASYYQQRCQAVANFQQQRCQQWAAAQRAKCQEMTQAAMVIVAWYIRDRIKRKRRKQKRGFKRGLKKKELLQQKERCTGVGLTNGETVRRWVMDVPIGQQTEGVGRDLPVDEEERAFDLDKIGAESGHGGGAGGGKDDKDNQLFQVADNMIKSQLARIDVPMLGVLNFDESESEDESDEEEEEEEEEADEEMGEEEEYEEEEYDYDEDEEEDGEYDLVEEVGNVKGKSKFREMTSVSKEAQLGTTTKGSREHSESFVS